MLPHPSYVYCAKYGPEKETIVATGCYDQIARIWASDRRSRKRELNQELEGHEGFVNSIVFQKSGNLITADSVGSIIIWVVHRNSRMPSKREWRISRKIKIREIEGVVINTIILHPLESRLLVHSRDNDLRLVDLATGMILQKYKQLNNQRYAEKILLSPENVSSSAVSQNFAYIFRNLFILSYFFIALPSLSLNLSYCFISYCVDQNFVILTGYN
jgi:jouberin